MKSRLINGILIDGLIISVGCVLYALAIVIFIEPNPIVPGGVTGISIILNHLFKLPIGLTIIIINIPLFIIGLIKFKLSFALKTVYATFLSSILMDVFAVYLKPYSADILLSALAGAVASGTGIALIMMRGATTGGTDIPVKLINTRFPFFSIGKAVLLLDGIVVILNTFVVKRFESLLYSCFFIFMASLVMDKLILGSYHGKLLYIITNEPLTITEKIISSVGRGVTKLNVTGGYTDDQKSMLMCACRPVEASEVISVVRSIDENAFVIVAEAGEILGFGFKQI